MLTFSEISSLYKFVISIRKISFQQGFQYIVISIYFVIYCYENARAHVSFKLKKYPSYNVSLIYIKLPETSAVKTYRLIRCLYCSLLRFCRFVFHFYEP